MYLDLDAVPIRSFAPLTSGAYSAVFGWEHDGGMNDNYLIPTLSCILS